MQLSVDNSVFGHSVGVVAMCSSCSKQLNSMKQSPFWEGNSRVFSQESTGLAWGLKIRCSIHGIPSLGILCWTCLFIDVPNFLKVYFNIIHLRLGLPSGVFSLSFSITVLCAFLFACVLHVPPVLSFIIFPQTVFNEQYTLCSFLQHAVTSVQISSYAFQAAKPSGEFPGIASITPPYHWNGRNDFLSLLTFKRPGLYLNFSTWSVKNLLFEQNKKINKMHCVENRTEIMQHVLKMQ